MVSTLDCLIFVALEVVPDALRDATKGVIRGCFQVGRIVEVWRGSGIRDVVGPNTITMGVGDFTIGAGCKTDGIIQWMRLVTSPDYKSVNWLRFPVTQFQLTCTAHTTRKPTTP